MVESRTRQKTLNRFYEIDLLRFMAALAVVLFHYTFNSHSVRRMPLLSFPELGQIFQYGYLGVDLFFMISGFVVLMSSFEKTAKKFAISRALRLYPIFWISVTLTALVTFVLGGEIFHVKLFEYFTNLTMFNGFFGIENVDGVYWTLGVEMRFYFLIFLVLIFQKLKNSEVLLGAWLIPSFIHSYFGIFSGLRFFLILEWAPYFIAGSIFYLIKKEGISFSKIAILLLAYFLSLKNALTRLVELQNYYQESFSSVIIVIIISIFYILFTLLAFDKIKYFRKKWLLLLGLLSYPLYLIHQNVGTMLLNNFSLLANKYVLLILVIILMLLISYAINGAAEKCLNYLKKYINFK